MRVVPLPSVKIMQQVLCDSLLIHRILLLSKTLRISSQSKYQRVWMPEASLAFSYTSSVVNIDREITNKLNQLNAPCCHLGGFNSHHEITKAIRDFMYDVDMLIN